MPFRLRRDTRKWFTHIEDKFDLDFDMYYLCLMAGIATGRKEDIPLDQTTELVDQFPGDYRSKGRVIIACFLSRELRGMGIKFSERTALNTAIQKLVDPLSASHLSELGMKEFNRYSYGGFEVLSDWFDAPPRKIETFLPLYKRYLDSAISETVS